MSVSQIGRVRPQSIRHLPVLAGNVGPLVGVLQFGWDPNILAVVYGIEFLLLFPLAAVKALFAQQPPGEDRDDDAESDNRSGLKEKRGSVRFHERLPPIYLRTVPFSLEILERGAFGSAFLLLCMSQIVPLDATLIDPAVFTGGLSLVAGQLIDTGYNYFHRKQYVEGSPYAVTERPFRLVFVLFFVLILLGNIDSSETLLVAGFVGVKTLSDWSAIRAEDGGGGRFTSWLAGPDEVTSLAPIDVPDSTPSVAVDVDRRAAVATALWRTTAKIAPLYVGMVALTTIAWFAVFADNGTPLFIAIVAGGLFVVLFSVALTERVLATGWMRYQRFEDQIVAIDRLTGEPQWSAPIETLRNVSADDSTVVDRLFGTRTIELTVGWDEDNERAIGPIDQPDALVEAFDFSEDVIELQEPNRWLAGSAIVSAIGILVGFAWLPWATMPVGEIVYALVVFPFLVGVPKILWYFAHR